ncbi:MAG: amidohydrolase family protein [Stellaceae bacterium]
MGRACASAKLDKTTGRSTNWPHPNLAGTVSDDGALLDLLADWAPAPALRRKILVENPAALYGFAL